MQLRFLSRADVTELMPSVDVQLDLVEHTYLAMAAGRVELPPKPGIHPRRDAFIHAMPAYLADSDIAALKWVAGYPANKQRGLPYISGVIVVNDAETGLPLAVMDAAEITAARTAAASGVCVRRLAPEGWAQVAILGCGEQGRYHALVLAALNPGLRIRAYDPDRASALSLPGPVDVVDEPEDAVRDAGVIVTAGPIVAAPKPPISEDWLPAACLLLPIDFDFYFRADAIRATDMFAVDDVEQFEYYRAGGHFEDWPPATCSTGEAIARGERPTRVACANLGVGSLDAAFASRVLEAANREGIGQIVQL
jgi:ornithine cyclodeaminase/alanine dehydrogenase-like protein (mu-crystallin family)